VNLAILSFGGIHRSREARIAAHDSSARPSFERFDHAAPLGACDTIRPNALVCLVQVWCGRPSARAGFFFFAQAARPLVAAARYSPGLFLGRLPAHEQRGL